MKLRDDIDPSNTWVVSDTHFGHDNIVGYALRPEDHEQVMIAQWRKVVPPDATVLHLGDLTFRGNSRFKNVIAPELTGARKLLILGNHDKQRYSFYRDSGFQVIAPFALRFRAVAGGLVQCILASSGSHSYDVSFSHYPWNPDDDGRMRSTDIRVHGHIHNNGYSRTAYVPFVKNHINISVEQTKYTPVNLQLLLDAAILGEFPQTDDLSRAEAQQRKEERPWDKPALLHYRRAGGPTVPLCGADGDTTPYPGRVTCPECKEAMA